MAAWLPLTAVFTTPVSVTARIAFTALALSAAIRPESALLVVAAFVAIADVVVGQAPLKAAALRGPETVVLAFLGGWFVANAIRPRSTPEPRVALRVATAILAFLIVASVTVTMAALQAQAMFPLEFVDRFIRFVATAYLKSGDPGDFASVMQGAWLLEGAALLFAARSITFNAPARRDAVVRMMIAGSAAAGALAIERFGRALLTQVDSGYVFRTVLSGEWRLPAHVSDTNAAGTGFMVAAIVALGYVAGHGRRAIGWSAAVLLSLTGLLISASRSAIIAGMLVLFAFAMLALARRRGRRITIAAVATVAGLAVTGAAIVFFAPNLLIGSKGITSLKMRWYFTQTALQILSLAPTFGVGLSRFREMSPRYMPAPLSAVYHAENAHNYFLQIAAEIGLAGLLAFAIVACTPVVRGIRILLRGGIDLTFAGIVGGAAVFLITSLTGHPFLTVAVTFPFWVLLGLCEAGSEAQSTAARRAARDVARPWIARPAVIVALALVAILATMPARIQGELRYVNFANVAYGVYDWEQSETGLRYRWTGPRARFFVPASARLVEFPVRALHFDPAHRETSVTILLDGRAANHLTLTDAEWRQVRLLIPPGSSRRFRQIDLFVSPTWSPAAVSAHSDSRNLGVIVGELMIRKMP